MMAAVERVFMAAWLSGCLLWCLFNLDIFVNTLGRWADQRTTVLRRLLSCHTCLGFYLAVATALLVFRPRILWYAPLQAAALCLSTYIVSLVVYRGLKAVIR